MVGLGQVLARVQRGAERIASLAQDLSASCRLGLDSIPYLPHDASSPASDLGLDVIAEEVRQRHLRAFERIVRPAFGHRHLRLVPGERVGDPVVALDSDLPCSCLVGLHRLAGGIFIAAAPGQRQAGGQEEHNDGGGHWACAHT